MDEKLLSDRRLDQIINRYKEKVNTETSSQELIEIIGKMIGECINNIEDKPFATKVASAIMKAGRGY